MTLTLFLSFLMQDPQALVYMTLAMSHGVAVLAHWRWHRLMLPCYLAAALAYALALAIHAAAHAPSPAPATVYALPASRPPTSRYSTVSFSFRSSSSREVGTGYRAKASIPPAGSQARPGSAIQTSAPAAMPRSQGRMWPVIGAS